MPAATIASADASARDSGTTGSHHAPDRRRTAAVPKTKPPIGALDGLLRADRRRQQAPAERAAGVVLRGVADDHGQHQQEQRLRGPAHGCAIIAPIGNAEIQRGKQRRRHVASASAPPRQARMATSASADQAAISTASVVTERGDADPENAASVSERGTSSASAAPRCRRRGTARRARTAREQQRRPPPPRTRRWRNQTTRDREGDEHGAAQDAGHVRRTAQWRFTTRNWDCDGACGTAGQLTCRATVTCSWPRPAGSGCRRTGDRASGRRGWLRADGGSGNPATAFRSPRSPSTQSATAGNC